MDGEAARLAAAVERDGDARVRLHSQRSELVAVIGAVDEHESFGLAWSPLTCEEEFS